MSEELKINEGHLALRTLGKVFYLSGVVSTLVVSPFYAWQHWEVLSITTWLILFMVAPVVNGFVSIIFLLLTFPVYRWLATKNLFGFGVVVINREQK